ELYGPAQTHFDQQEVLVGQLLQPVRTTANDPQGLERTTLAFLESPEVGFPMNQIPAPTNPLSPKLRFLQADRPVARPLSRGAARTRPICPSWARSSYCTWIGTGRRSSWPRRVEIEIHPTEKTGRGYDE